MQLDRRDVLRGAAIAALTPWPVLAQTVPPAPVPTSNRRPFTWALILFRPEDRRVDVAGFARVLAQTLTHHVLVDDVAAWDGAGLLPISVRKIDAPERSYGDIEATFGIDIADAIGVPPKRLRAIEIVITAPPTLDVEPFREIVRFGFDLGRATGSRFVMDGVTNTALGACDKGEPLEAPTELELKHIAPADFEGRSIATEGLRRVGLPDLVMTDAALIEETKVLVAIVAEAMLDGLAPVNGRLTVPRDHRAVKEYADHEEPTADLHFDFGPPHEAMHQVSVAADPSTPPQVAQVEMLASIGRGPLRGQIDVVATGQIQALTRAVGALHARLPRLAETWRPGVDGHVFVRKELVGFGDMSAKDGQTKRVEDLPTLYGEVLSRLGVWHRVDDWRDPTEMKVTAWRGDPRTGGTPLPPLDARSMLPFWLRWMVDADPEEKTEMKEGEIRDLLILHKDGRVEGGEISAVAFRLMATPDLRQKP